MSAFLLQEARSRRRDFPSGFKPSFAVAYRSLRGRGAFLACSATLDFRRVTRALCMRFSATGRGIHSRSVCRSLAKSLWWGRRICCGDAISRCASLASKWLAPHTRPGKRPLCGRVRKRRLRRESPPRATAVGLRRLRPRRLAPPSDGYAQSPPRPSVHRRTADVRRGDRPATPCAETASRRRPLRCSKRIAGGTRRHARDQQRRHAVAFTIGAADGGSLLADAQRRRRPSVPRSRVRDDDYRSSASDEYCSL